MPLMTDTSHHPRAAWRRPSGANEFQAERADDKLGWRARVAARRPPNKDSNWQQVRRPPARLGAQSARQPVNQLPSPCLRDLSGSIDNGRAHKLAAQRRPRPRGADSSAPGRSPGARRPPEGGAQGRPNGARLTCRPAGAAESRACAQTVRAAIGEHPRAPTAQPARPSQEAPRGIPARRLYGRA